MITFVFFIILFTAAFGRLFCGWACPQTNFMEMMFRKVEFWVLGDAPAQRQLKEAPWTVSKILKVTLKHVLFYGLSFIIANFFLAYIIGVEDLYKIITEPISLHLVGFSSLLIFSAVFYAVYAFFREQACTVVCPYGRLQSVLLDRNSMIVAYDYKRGEPRGHAKNLENLGDCIDCHQCVKVCPTGIDIRNGVQMECVGCTACIDACDHIMDKLEKPRGLIRYASENTIANGEPLRYTNRMKMYTALCFLLLSVLTVLLVTRKDIDATIIRTAGMLYQERGTDSISNLYSIKMVNKTTKDVFLQVLLNGKIVGRIEMIGAPILHVKKEALGAGTFFIVLPRQAITSRKTELSIALIEGGKVVGGGKTTFLGPAKKHFAHLN
jgi:cytochrome c oxidase accessory protein FixG